MAYIIQKSRAAQLLIGETDYTSSLISFQVSDSGAFKKGLMTTSGTVILGQRAGVGEIEDYDRNMFKRGQVVKLDITNPDGGTYRHPRGLLYVVSTSYDVEKEQLLIEVGCQLSLAYLTDDAKDILGLVPIPLDPAQQTVQNCAASFASAGEILYQDNQGNLSSHGFFSGDSLSGVEGGSWVSVLGETALSVAPLQSSGAIPDEIQLSYQVPEDTLAEDESGKVDATTETSRYFINYPATIWKRVPEPTPSGEPQIPEEVVEPPAEPGGGGASKNDSATPASIRGDGGSGIVIVRYKTNVKSAKATGGSVSFYNGKTIHTFTSSGAFASSNAFNETCECVIVGGGGGTSNPSASGAHGAGGGGAGAVYDRDNISLNLSGPWTFNVTVGAGGAKGSSGNKGSNGANSVVAFPTGTLTAPGGGAGGISYPGGPPYRTVGSPGGAGGGGSNYGGSEPKDGGDGDGAPWPGTPGNDPGVGWGGDGGDGRIPGYSGGGGGGAQDGPPGFLASPDPSGGGPGGGGYLVPTTYRDPESTLQPGPGSSTFYVAGGGGGGTYNDTNTGGVGGSGPAIGTPYAGAGDGGYRSGPASGAGVSNSGSGAGGGGGGNTAAGNAGGSGIVLIAYPT